MPSYVVSMLLQTGMYWTLGYIVGFKIRAAIMPSTKTWYKRVSEQTKLKGHTRLFVLAFKYLPLVVATNSVAACYVVGFIADDGAGQLTRSCILVLAVALFFSAWFQLDWLGTLAQSSFPYLTWTGPCKEANDDQDYLDDETGKPLIALSIDDVPATFEKFGASGIEACLKLLDEHDAKATLFLMSQELAKHDDHAQISRVLVDALGRGYEIGNHDLLDVKTVRRGADDFATALRECDDVIANLMQSANRPWRGWREFTDEESIGTQEPAFASSKEPADSGAVAWAKRWMADWVLKGDETFEPVDRSRPPPLELRRTKSAGFRDAYKDPALLASRGESIKWFRPGGGFFHERMVRQAAQHGYSTVLGSCFPFDTHMPAKHNAAYLLLRAQPGKIIVLHDRPGLLSVLEAVLPTLSAKYKIVTLSGLFQAAAARTSQTGVERCVANSDAHHDKKTS